MNGRAGAAARTALQGALTGIAAGVGAGVILRALGVKEVPLEFTPEQRAELERGLTFLESCIDRARRVIG